MIFCYCPQHFFRLIEGQQSTVEKFPVVGLEPLTLELQGQRLHHSSTELLTL